MLEEEHKTLWVVGWVKRYKKANCLKTRDQVWKLVLPLARPANVVDVDHTKVKNDQDLVDNPAWWCQKWEQEWTQALSQQAALTGGPLGSVFAFFPRIFIIAWCLVLAILFLGHSLSFFLRHSLICRFVHLCISFKFETILQLHYHCSTERVQRGCERVNC